VNDSGTQGRCTEGFYNVLANDSDVDGDYPLTLVSVTGAGFGIETPTQVRFTSGALTGARYGTYTVQDARGATATGTLAVNVFGGSC
jgi:hypothetical protein